MNKNIIGFNNFSGIVFYRKCKLILVFIFFFNACSPPADQQHSSSVELNDTTGLVRKFIFGLWSLDSGNTLCNAGYQFTPEGRVHVIASEYGGFWEITGKDSLKLTFQHYSPQATVLYLHLDSISTDRMVLTGEKGKLVFRKVPFGQDNEGKLINGFSGQIESGEEKEYIFQLPSAKMIEVRLQSKDTTLHFRVYEEQQELTAIAIRKWETILARAGKYKILVKQESTGTSNGMSDFDLKVLSY